MAEDQIEFLKEYNEWIEQRKRISRDLTPEAFLVDRAKDEALDRLIEIEELLDKFADEDEALRDYITRLEEVVDGVTRIVKGDDS